MNINRNNRRSVPTLIISGLGVVAAAITWLSFKQVAANAPPSAKPKARATAEQLVDGSSVKHAQDGEHAAVGITNLDLNRNPILKQQAK